MRSILEVGSEQLQQYNIIGRNTDKNAAPFISGVAFFQVPVQRYWQAGMDF